jgi:2-hydroxy-3-keto-5-methylthiopentenyl-1-phosphate phosphatase
MTVRAPGHGLLKTGRDKVQGTIIVTDFDGTITDKDSNAVLVEQFGDEYNLWLEEQYILGTMGTREAADKHFGNLKMNEEEYKDFILAEIGIDPGFREFYTKAKQAGIPLVVISGGYVNAIDIVLDREGMEIDTVLANRLEFTPEGIMNHFYHASPDCPMDFGPCGNCKASHIKGLKEQYRQVVFIGDGLTDRCAAHHAHVVYAKGRLAEYCREQGFKYIPFEDFFDVTRHMFGREE